jgi:hypothetical protein
MKEEAIARSIKNHLKAIYPNVVAKVNDHVKHNFILNLFPDDPFDPVQKDFTYTRFVDMWLSRFSNVKQSPIFITFTIRPKSHGEYIMCMNVRDWFYTCKQCGIKTDYKGDQKGFVLYCCPDCERF